VKDVQSLPDKRRINIDKVGIKGLKLPIVLNDPKHGTQRTVADVSFYVDLPHHFKGTHMSRFLEILNQCRDSLDISRINDVLQAARQKLKALKAHLELTFPYFLEKKAPVSGSLGMIDYECTISAAGNGSEHNDVVLSVKVPVTSLCPCSKEISDRGAHNQRSLVTLSVRSNRFVWLEELIRIVEQEASCEIFSLLKREDEKHVTEAAYDNPVFVEDMVRGITQRLAGDARIDWFRVESENFESIHNHNAYALIERNLKAERRQVSDKLAAVGEAVTDE
jgi:GTP cyclohydrolase I